MKKTFCIIISVIIAFSLIISALYASIALFAFNINFYKSEYIKNDTYSVVRMEESDLIGVTEHMIKYLHGGEKDLQIQTTVNDEARGFFSEIELDHMVDVLFILFVIQVLAIISIVCLIVFIPIIALTKSFRLMLKTVLITILSFAGLMLILTAVSAINFDAVFVLFHEIFFNNDKWILNPAVDLLINIVPFQFFVDIALYAAISFLSMLAAVCIACAVTLKLTTPKRRSGIYNKYNAIN